MSQRTLVLNYKVRARFLILVIFSECELNLNPEQMFHIFCGVLNITRNARKNRSFLESITES